MHMPDWGVVIMDRPGILNVIVQFLRQGKERRISNLPQAETSVIVFPPRIRTNLEMVEKSPFGCLVYQLIDLVPGKGTINTKQRPGHFLPVAAGAVLDVLDGFFDLADTIRIACFNN